MKKIAIILGSMGRGGAERVASILSADYAKQGWQVDLVLLLFNKVEYELHPNVNVIDLSFSEERSRVKRAPLWLSGIRKYIKENRPEVVLSFAARINVLVQLACTGLRQKIFISERNDPKCDGRSKLVDIATKMLYPRAAGCIFQTQRAASYFPQLKNKTIIANPIAVAEQAAEQKKKKIVKVGRLAPQKNQKMLIGAFSKIAERFPQHTLDIYGAGELQEELSQYAYALGVGERVIFHGNAPDVHRQIADAEVFCLSSDYEGLSNALLEAMMMGLPCISTDCAGSDEYICSGENGILVPVGDEAAMAEALIAMLSDEQLRNRCAQQAKNSAVAVSTETVLLKWHELLDC